MSSYEMIDAKKYAWKRTHFCEINGEVMPYWGCDENDNNWQNSPKYAHLNLRYLGCGRIYSVDGVVQNDSRLMHFYSLEK